jgi:5-formyltetrahydrofolate cyclo-ligase
MSPTLVEAKRALRREMADRRAALPADERLRCSRRVCERLLVLPEVVAAATVAGFSALPVEIDPAAALEALARRGARVALPRVTALRPRMRFHEGGGPLAPGRFDILEPAATAPEVSPGEVDVFLVPGLAFDPSGQRVGFGGGYYDELGALVRRGPAFLIGLGFDFQLVERCPTGDADVAIDCVVTDARVIRCRASGAVSPP